MSSIPLANPYLSIEGYNCFGCSPHNPYGLHLQFHYDDEADEVWAIVSPPSEPCGYPGVLHGGIQATMMDEVGYWAVHHRVGLPAFTVRMKVDLKRAVAIPSEIHVRARVDIIQKKRATVSVRLLIDGREHSSAAITYHIADANTWLKVTGRLAPEACIRSATTADAASGPPPSGL